MSPKPEELEKEIDKLQQDLKDHENETYRCFEKIDVRLQNGDKTMLKLTDAVNDLTTAIHGEKKDPKDLGVFKKVHYMWAAFCWLIRAFYGLFVFLAIWCFYRIFGN